MRAVKVEAFGSVDRAVLADMPEPVPGPGQVLIQIHAVAVNFVDLVVIAGKYQFLPALPFIPGKGPAGVVIRIGDRVTGLRVGDRVLAMAEYGGYAEMVAVDADQCYRLPNAMQFSEAASMSLAFDTAWFALRERGRVQPGDVVLVLGATGAVGFAAVQLAKSMGASVLAGVSTIAKAGAVQAAGADALVDLSVDNLRDGLREQVYRHTQGRGADVVIDMLGGGVFDAALRAVAWCGRMVVVGFATGTIPSVKVNYLLVKNIEVSGLQISDYRKRRPELVRHCYEEIFAFHEQGLVRPARPTVLPLADFALGLKMLQERTTKGRVVLTLEH